MPATPGLSLSAGLHATGNSWADNLNSDRLPGYTVYDLGLRYQHTQGAHPVTLRMDITNAGNKHYWSGRSALGEPRTLMLSASYRF